MTAENGRVNLKPGKNRDHGVDDAAEQWRRLPGAVAEVKAAAKSKTEVKARDEDCSRLTKLGVRSVKRRYGSGQT